MLATLFSLLLLLMPVGLVQAQESADYVNTFGGVDNYQDSSKIAKTDAQDARNVLTDTGKLTKRPGSAVMATVVDGFPVYTLGEFISPSNVRYLIAQASTTVYASDLSATGFVAIATVTANYPLDLAPAFGRMYFTNGIDTPFYWDGTSMVTQPAIPVCAQMEFADERLYCSNAPNFRSTVYASRYADATDWIIPAVSPLPADAPNSFTFNRNDGDQILCSKVTPWGKFYGKKNSSYALKGQDNDRYYKQLVSPTVGCIDDRSVQMVDGKLVWLAQDSTIYSWDGASAPIPISRDIDSYVKDIRQGSSQQNNYNTSTLTEWSAGSLSPNGSRTGLDFTTWPSSVRPSTWTYTETSTTDWNTGTLVMVSTEIPGVLVLKNNLFPNANFEENSFSSWTNLSAWVVGTTGACEGTYSAYIGCANNTRNIKVELFTDSDILISSRAHSSSIACTLFSLPIQYTGAVYVKVTDTPSGNNLRSSTFTQTTAEVKYYLQLTAENCSAPNIGVHFDMVSPTNTLVGTFTSQIFDTTFSTPIGGPFLFSETVPVGSTIAYSIRSSSTSVLPTWSAWSLVSTTPSGGYRIPLTKEFWQYKLDFTTSYSTQTPSVSDITLNAISSGTYYSNPQYIGTAITSWDLFSADQQGSSSFYIRSATQPFTVLSSTPTWNAQTNSTTISIATGSYVQFKFDSIPVTSTQTIQVDGVNIAWREGDSKPLASLYDDHRYILCANTSTSTVVNDLCLVWQKNKKWIPFSGQSWGALARFNNYAIAGDGSTSSKIWKVLDPTYLNDDGVPIDAYWVSKDFDYDKPNQLKVPMKLWLETDNIATSFLTVGFAADKGVAYSSTTIDLAQSSYLNTNVSSIFDGFALGKYFKFKFSDNTLNSTFKVNAYSVYYDSKPLGQE